MFTKTAISSGAGAALASLCAIGAAALYERKSPIRPVNATSHVAWGDRAGRTSEADKQFAAATADELSELMSFTRDAEIALTEAYQPQGINVGINLGRPAGAGIIDHIHIHLVPRWTGDTNFMSVIGGTRVLPEDMRDTVARLKPIFGRLYDARLASR